MGGIGLFDKNNSNGQQKMEHESATRIHRLKDVSGVMKDVSGVIKDAVCTCTELDQFSPSSLDL